MSQEKLIADFTEWTGCSQQTAIDYLSYTNGNMENAIKLYFDNGGADLTVVLNNIPTTTIKPSPKKVPRANLYPPTCHAKKL